VVREKGLQVTLVQRIHAEGWVVVAAASILARAKFVQQLEQFSRRIGKTLPKGASDPAIVAIGREIVARHGKEILAEIAKLHFKITEMILQSLKEFQSYVYKTGIASRFGVPTSHT